MTAPTSTTLLATAVLLLTLTNAARPAALIDVVRPGQSPGGPACKTPATCQVQPVDCSSPATASLSVSPSTIRQGDGSTLRWSVTFAAACAPRPLKLNGQAVAARGAMQVTPLALETHKYVLTMGRVTVASAAVTVFVPSVVRIRGNDREARQLLIMAVGTPHTTVLLGPDVDMDLSAHENIRINEGVTLMGEGPAAATPVWTAGSLEPTFRPARDARHLGPRLYTTRVPNGLFTLRCDKQNRGDNVRILGFRLQGPQLDIEDDDQKYARGIWIDSCNGIEIADMELSGWSGQAIYLRDSALKMLNPSAVWIHDNFFHHNQHTGGFGYGVDVNAGAYALIERNVFDFNRHAIAGSGEPGTGYNAQYNLVLRGGGVHDGVLSYYTHQFDVHGDQNCPDIWPFQHTYQCGNAGDQFWITANAFQYRNAHAIKLRGAPRVAAYIRRNVFPHDSLGDAIKLNDDDRVHVGPNTIDADTFGRYGVCDFDGDGKDDLFLPTGVSWWYSSGGRMHWSFLNAQSEGLDQVGLGDFDGDRRCDVFAVRSGRWEISSGGTAPWRPLPGNLDIPFDQLAFGDFNGDAVQDVFHRAPNGQWSAVSPGIYDWMDLWRSPAPLSALRFGDFDGDGVTDVLGRDDGVLSVSRGGRTVFEPLPGNLSDDPSSLFIGDVDGIAGDDLVRFVHTPFGGGHWEVASSGVTAWQFLTGIDEKDTISAFATSFIGRFDDSPGADLLMVDRERRGRIRSGGASGFVLHSRYAY